MRLHPSGPYRSPERRVSKPSGSPLRPPSSPRYAGSPLRPPSCALRRASCQPSHSPENQGSLRRNPTSGLYEDMRCTPWFRSVPAPGSSQLDTGLFFNALQCSDGDVPFWVRDRHAALFRRVFELLVAANLIHFVPAIPRQRLITSRLSIPDHPSPP